MATPKKAAPAQNTGKEPSKMALAQIRPAAIPKPAPMLNPARRPIHFISSEAGIVVAMVAPKATAIGKVARVLSVASMVPTRAATVMTSELALMVRAWQQASNATFLTVGSLASVPEGMGRP